MRGRSPRRSTRIAPPSRRRELFLPSLARGDPHDDRVRRNVSGDYGPGAHEGSRPDPDPPEDDPARSERGPALHDGSQESPIGIALRDAFVCRCSREPVVDEQNPVADEDLILDLHAAADERVAGNLARLADRGPSLHLHERSDPTAAADAAPVEVAERPDRHVLAELDLVDDPKGSVVRRLIGHARSNPRRGRHGTLGSKKWHAYNLCAEWPEVAPGAGRGRRTEAAL